MKTKTGSASQRNLLSHSKTRRFLPDAPPHSACTDNVTDVSGARIGAKCRVFCSRDLPEGLFRQCLKGFIGSLHHPEGTHCLKDRAVSS